MSPTVLPRASRRQGLCGAHVLGIFVGFFAAVFMVNGVMIYSAVSTYTGVVASEPYRKGLHYNERITADERQALLGWIETLDLSRDGRVRLTLGAPDGHPVGGLRIAAVLGRPATNRHDIKLALTETAPGRYEAQAGALAAGSWLATLEARTAPNAESPIFRTRRRIWLTP